MVLNKNNFIAVIYICILQLSTTDRQEEVLPTKVIFLGEISLRDMLKYWIQVILTSTFFVVFLQMLHWLGLCMWKQAHLFIYLLPYIRRSSVHIFPKLLAHHSFTHSSSSDQQSQSSDQVNSPFICLRHLPGLFSDAQFLGYSCLLTNQIVCGQTLLVIIVIVSHSVMSHSLQPHGL